MKLTDLFLKSVLFICLFQIFCSINLFAQGQFVLSGTIDMKYEGGYIKLMGGGIKFSSIKSDIKNGRFYFSDKIEKEYELVGMEV